MTINSMTFSDLINVKSFLPEGESRSQTILRHYESHCRSTIDSWNALMSTVVEYFIDECGRLEVIRSVRFDDPRLIADGEGYMRALQSNGQRLRRLFESGEIPLDLEDALIVQAPVVMREGLIRDLSARWGVVPMNSVEESNGVLDVYSVLAESQSGAGLSTQLLVQMLATGDGLGPEDAHLAPGCLRAIEGVMASFNVLRDQIRLSVLGGE